jgi:hypothetical protein
VKAAIQRPDYAYVKDKNSGEYLVDSETGELLQVSIEKAIRIKTDDNKTHKSRTYWNLNPNEDKRYQLRVHTVNHQFERHKSGENVSEFDRSYDESMSHKCVIEALSRLNSITLVHVEGDRRIPMRIDFRTVEKTPYLHLPNREKYYPDILCTFGEESEFYDKWGGKFAIEVTYTHGCESYKEEDFMFHNIPVFEITIEDGSARQFPAERPDWPKGKHWDNKLVERHINQLVEWFSQNVVGELIVNPTSTRFHLQEVEKLENKLNLQKSDNRLLNDKLQSLERENIGTLDELMALQQEHERALTTAKDYKSAYKKLKRRNAELSELLEDNKRVSKSHISQLEEKLSLYDDKLKDSNQTISLQKYAIYFLMVAMTVVLFVPFISPEGSLDILNGWYKSMVELRHFIF